MHSFLQCNIVFQKTHPNTISVTDHWKGYCICKYRNNWNWILYANCWLIGSIVAVCHIIVSVKLATLSEVWCMGYCYAVILYLDNFHSWGFTRYLTLMLLVADLANTKWCKNPEKYPNPVKWVLIRKYPARAIQWIPTPMTLRPCASD